VVTMKNAVFWDDMVCGSVRTDCCHPGDGGATFPRNIGSYKSHMA
jgi:hypothetical protein